MTPTSRWSLPTLDAVRALAIGLVLGALALWAVSANLTQAQNERAGALAAGSAIIAAEMMDANVQERTSELQLYRRSIASDGLLADLPRLRKRLEAVQEARPGYSWLGLASPEGRITVGTGGLAEGADVGKRTWFTGGRQGLYHGDVHEAVLLQSVLPPLPGGEPWRFIDIAMPLHDREGRLLSVLAVHLSWPWLRERIAVVNATLPHRGSFWLVGNDGIARTGDGTTGATPLALESLRLAREGRSGWLVETWPDGQRYITAYAPNRGSGNFQGFGWVTLVRAPADIWPPAVRQQFHQLALLAGVILILVTGLVWVLSRIGLRPLHDFIDRVARLGEGEPAPRLPARLPQEWHALHQGIVRLVERLDQKERQVRAALADVQSSFRSVGKNLPGVLATARLEDGFVQFTYVSENASAYFGVSGESLLADSTVWRTRADPQDLAAFEESARALRVGDGYVMAQAIRFTGADGAVRTLHNLIVRRDEGDARIFDWIGLDISDLVAARAEAERASRAKSDFLATMSHELRTPLNAIMGFARVLEETLPDREHRRQSRFVRETAEVLTRILNDVLDLAKVDTGKFALDPRPFALGQVLDSCRAIYRVAAAEKGLDFQVRFPPGLPTLVGDPIRLRQVLENLLSNAFKFTASGAVLLEVSFDMTEATPGRARMGLLSVQVVDTGIGMTPEQLTRVFERFEQADRSVKMRYGGAGLGLSIVKALVEKMGGSIKVHSEAGTGTQFGLTLPLPVADPAPAPAEPAVLDEPESPLKVLVADDLSLNRIVIRAQLELRGHQVVEARDGVEALQRVREEQPDLVLMDIDMPALDGIEATRRLRAMEAAGRRTPVWALTGKAFAEDEAASREAGMDGHLAKPVSLEALVAVLRSVRRPRIA